MSDTERLVSQYLRHRLTTTSGNLCPGLEAFSATLQMLAGEAFRSKLLKVDQNYENAI